MTVQILANAVVMLARRASRSELSEVLFTQVKSELYFQYSYQELTQGQSHLKFTSACHMSRLLCGMKHKDFKDSFHKIIFAFVGKPICLRLCGYNDYSVSPRLQLSNKNYQLKGFF